MTIKIDKYTTASALDQGDSAGRVRVILIGGGGGGGGGARDAESSGCAGGGGGGGAACPRLDLRCRQLATTESYSVAPVTPGGVGGTAPGTGGNTAGAAGESSTFTINGVTTTAYGGGGGSRGDAH